MSAQHTPGPWTIAHSTISWWIKAPSDQSGQLAGGALPADTWHMTREQRRESTAMANARLIAAAPEMLAALEAIEAAPAWGAPDRWETTPTEVRVLARAAIAKARGEVA